MRHTNLLKSALLIFSVVIFAACSRYDADAQRDVGAKLREDKRFDRVTLTVKKGDLTLDGEVETGDAKQTAETITKEIKGVKNVTNNLQIKPLPAPTATPTAAPSVTPSPKTRRRK